VRLVLWCSCFATGAALSAWPAAARAAVVAGAAGGALIAVLGRGRRLRVSLAPAALALGLGALLALRARVPPPLPPALDRLIAEDRAAVIDGAVARGPEWAGRGARLVVDVVTADGAPAQARLALAVDAGWPDFGPGDQVRFTARLHPLRGTRNPGLPDWTLGFRAAGIDLVAGVASPAAIRRLVDRPPRGPRRWAFEARRAMRAAIERAVAGAPAAFLKTAVLGDRRGVGNEVEDGFRAAGATHVLSVSGLHLAAVAAVVFFLFRWAAALVPRLPLHVDPRAVAAAVVLPLCAFFTLLTGEAVATERSALMLALAMGGLVLGRPVSPAATISAAVLALLVSEPLRVFDVSLQLSAASVAGIALLARRIGPPPARAPSPVARALRWLWRFGAATGAATAVTAPLVAHCFGEVAPAAALGNLALVPLVEMVVVPCGLLGAAASAVWMPLGRAPLAVAAGAARLALAVAEAFRLHAPLWTCRTPNLFETAAFMAAGASALWALGARGRARRVALAAALVAATAGAVSLALRDLARRHARDLRITFLDVGQGDSAVIEAPGGAVMLVDGGGSFDKMGTLGGSPNSPAMGSGEQSSPSPDALGFDPGERIVEPFLRARGITRLELVALSHPHPDHLNGLVRVLERFDVGALWTSGDDGHNPEYARLLEIARRRRVPAPVPAAAALGGARVEPLGPFVAAPGGGEHIGPVEGLSVNDGSLVLRVAFAGRAALFAGDLEADGEGELAGRRAVGQAVAADVLKVPHHGSRTSSTPELLDAVAPALAVISLGWRNRFHFPAPEVVARYHARGTRVLRTDRDGAITVMLRASGALDVWCERGCAE
jgi:competence protein ComEC